MTDHERALELAATAFDFELSPADAEVLTAHLQSCRSCRLVSEGLRADAVAFGSLEREDAPESLRSRILHAADPTDAVLQADTDVAPLADRTQQRGMLLRLPPRLRHPAVLVAAAAVIVAVVGGTLAWQAGPAGPAVAVVDPSSRPTAGPGGSSEPAGSNDPGDPGDSEATLPPGAPGPGLVTAWSPLADLTALKSSGGVVDLDTGFVLAGLAGTPATELASRVTVQPVLKLTATTEADGRVLLTPAEPLTPGAVYRFTLAGDEGETLDTWAFQARQPLRVVSTLPADSETGVRRDTGIEVTFDQDGVVGAAAHMTIEPKIEGRFEQHDRVLAFIPDRLAPATVYTVTVSRGVTVGATGEQLEDDVRFQFETAAAGSAGPAELTFRFATDLFESARADRSTIALWSYQDSFDENDEPKPPQNVRLEVYRLADQSAAIAAFRQLRSLPRWSLWNSDERVPTDQLTRVARFDARLEEVDGTLWTRLPEPLAAGWYLVQYPSRTRPAQAILQVTDIAGYLAVSETKTLVWANDLATGRPIAGAVVSGEGASLGRTNADGTLFVSTPAELLPDQSGDCREACQPVVTISSGGRSAFLPATGENTPEGTYGEWSGFSVDGHPRFWRLLKTDRMTYRQTDTINVWGMLRDRDSGKVPETVTLRLVVDDGDTIASPPLAQLAARPRPTGTFSGSLALRDVPEGIYQVELVEGDEIIATHSVEVGRILKPAYRLDVVTGRRVYVAGDRIRVTATASFFEGTPVPGVPLHMNGFIESSPTTDATGTAIVRGTARLSEGDDDQGDPSYQSVSVNPARPEEGDIGGASHEFVVFPSMWTVAAESEVRGGRVRVSGDVSVVDRDRLEREIAAGSPIWDLDPAGAPVADRTVAVSFTELIPIRTQTGTRYDFIEKRVVPVYEYDQRERSAGTRTMTTDKRGHFSGSVTTPDEDHDYFIRISLTDPDGHVAKRTTYASKGARFGSELEEPSLRPTDIPDEQFSNDFGVGDEIDLTMREPGSSAAVVAATADDPHLFYVAQLGLREATVRPSSRFTTRFQDWGPPNLYIGAVRFTGHGYVVAPRFGAFFRASDRAIAVDLQPDKGRYAPGEKVTLGVRTRDARGRAVPATVVVSAVDEKLFAIGTAAVADPLPELYASLDDGIRATYASHRTPRGHPGSGDTGGGGGDDFRDSVLFKAIDTGPDGRASVTFDLSDDLTSWHVIAAAIGAGVQAGVGSTMIPVGLPFFVDASIAPEYLLADRPTIQIRGFGSALDPDDRVTFTVDGDSLGLHERGLRADAFEAVTVRLPALKLVRHSITINATTGSGSSARRYRVVRTFEVVASRLTRTRTDYVELSGKTGLEADAGLTEIVVSDASSGRELPLLLDLASGGSARLERALAADVAATLVEERVGADHVDPSAATFDGTAYQRADGGIAIVPYASSDLEVSASAALVAPDRFSAEPLRTYFRTIADGAAETRERQNFALAGLAGLGAPVLPDIRAAAADTGLTIRERLMLGLGAAALGDAGTARSVAVSLVEGYGEAVGEQARLRAGDDAADVSTATALMAMLMAAIGDPAAPRYHAYVEANPSNEATYALQQVGYAARALEHRAPQAGSFAYEVGGKRQIVELGPGETFRLTLTKGQLATFAIEPVEGAIGVTTSWDEPVKASALKPDPDVKIKRTVTPSGIVKASDLVVVDLRVTFGAKAAAGCHRVTELVPSGLVPVSVLRALIDPETGDPMPDVIYPEEQAGQRVTFCAASSPERRSAHLRYVARVITVGTYEWEPTIVESRSARDRAAIVPADKVTIR